MAAPFTDVAPLDLEIRKDGRVLVEVVELLAAKTPLDIWPDDAVAALAEALEPPTSDRLERGKAERLTRHLFAGPAPPALVTRAGGPPRRADRLRADLADLTPYGSGLHLLASLR